MHQVLPSNPEEAFLTPLDVASDVGLSSDKLVRMYRTMALIRALDRRMLDLRHQGRVGFYASALGEEAAVVGSALALGRGDWVFPALRQGGAALLLGLPLPDYIAQCLGSSTDPAHGRQTPGCFTALEPRFVSTSSCAGNQLPHAAGAGIAARLSGAGAVMLGCMRDGETSEPDFHLALEMAAAFRAQTVFFCQSTQWEGSPPFARQTAAESISIKAEAYGLPGIRVDGDDPLAVYELTCEAIGRARGGEGATLIEAVSYRSGARALSDEHDPRRGDDEAAEWRAEDPLMRLRAFLTGTGLWDDAGEDAQALEITAEIDAAIAAAEGSPPAADTLFTDVYAELPPHLKIQRHELLQRSTAQRSRGD